MTELPSLAEDCIAAYGGLGRWRRVAGVAVDFSARGPAFGSKLRPRALRDLRVHVPTNGLDVRVVGIAGRELDPGPDHSTRRPARRMRWTDPALGAFVRAAMWTYVSVPFCLPEHAVSVREISPWIEAGERWRRLEVEFGPDVATHCPTQVFHLDDDLRIRRHDYSALAFGRWARAAHYSSDFTDCDGLLMPRTRRVHPRRANGEPRRHLTLVRIDVHAATLEPAVPDCPPLG